eukprot:CAMPEP_0168370256 /NCGR_PEP_ID=MMETSP0228-20121227/7174_1 /TAXON_ID=133427 /ORGANISM="Protoceratium reticulatum, Strain CCCM 535 (=CCMP 1889)" /LENGTH=179 /DNA_ID=CAMNT_0008383131 /DNA_START=9 /DNA_END=544 /DNA_ORIENTATION=-
MMDDVPAAEQRELLQDQPSQAPADKSRGLKIAGAVLAALALLAAAVALVMQHSMPPSRARDRSLTEGMEGACKAPEDFCKTNPNREDKLSFRDCDGDGILDPYCEGGELLRFGFVSSKDGCKNNWPNGICVREVEPPKDQGEFGNKAASNEITIIHFNDVYQVSGALEGGVRRGGMSRA